ncbi:MAG: hypothetical protein PWQ60_2453 [Thermoanaerobacteraceae bacterium]|nr:hypothetical protein [Thermoanaerobacteraceae bacterium]
MKRKILMGLTISLIASLFFMGCNKTVDDNKESSVKSEVQVEKSDFGAKEAISDNNLNLEKMLRYAIEDEFLARSEYEAIIEKFGQVKPFTNIIKAEEKHISMLKDLYSKYNYKIPEDNSKDHIIIPQNLNDSFKAGVNAEIDNIAMYDKFLKQDIPDDIKKVFVELRDASKNHLSAFQKNVK